MRGFVTFLAASAIALMGCSASVVASGLDLEQREARESYSLGSVIGEQLEQGVRDVDTEAFLAGVGDAFGDATRLSPDQIDLALRGRQEAMEAAARAEALALVEKNGAEGASYREAFGKDPKTVTLASGLQYKVLRKGDGKVPAPADTVKVHYRGTFVDGTEFDSSYTRQAPAQFPVEGLIPGWSEALQLMPAGSMWQVVIPPELAYGDQGAGEFIEPGSTLVFEMELLEVNEMS